MPARALDHLVLGTRDLEKLAAEFGALGFGVGARNRHPWGTENRLIQLADQTFLELIAVGEGAEIAPHQPGHFSFGAFVREGIQRAPGLSMLALRSADSRADAARFAREGLGAFAPFHFVRKGQRPDGSTVELAFTLAFAHEPMMRDCGFFTCQQHFPENFWNPALQRHENGATGISRVTLVAENPSDHHVFLSGFAGSREMQAGSGGIAILCGSTRLEILSAEAFRFIYGTPAAEPGAARFAGFGIAAADPVALAAQARRLGLPVVAGAAGPAIEARPGFETAIVLERGA